MGVENWKHRDSSPIASSMPGSRKQKKNTLVDRAVQVDRNGGLQRLVLKKVTFGIGVNTVVIDYFWL